MRSVMFVIILLVAGIAGIGYYRGWFAVSTDSTDNTPSATITVDKDKFHADEQKAKAGVQGFGQDAKTKIGGPVGSAKQPQPQP